MSDAFWTAFLLLSAGMAFLLYILPLIVAAKRNHSQAAPIAVVTLFLGWTLIGWVLALAWSLSTPQRRAY